VDEHLKMLEDSFAIGIGRDASELFAEARAATIR
jgi:hypothetical protein